MVKGFTRNFKPLEILNEEKLDQIERGVFHVLEKVGLKFEVETKKTLQIFGDGGCSVDMDKKVVKFPPGLVKECIGKCPGHFRVEARDPENDLHIGGSTVYFQPGPGMWYWDLDTRQPRLPKREEFYDAVKVYDALPNLHFFHANSPNTNMEGVHPLLSTIETYIARARYSSKVNFFGASAENERFIFEIARVLGAKGFYGGGAISPLGWNNDTINGMIRAVEEGIPLVSNGGSVWGASAPATIAGQLITNIVEDLGPLVLAQLVSPGHPVLPGSFTFPMNMQTGDPFFCNIAISLATAAFTQFWRRYNIPTFLIEASIPNSKSMDFQSGYEKGMNGLAQALSGAAVVWIHGTVYGELTAHPVQAIMDDDIAGMIGRFLEGIRVNDETLALDLIEEVGTIPGIYLDTEHTRRWWKEEQFIPSVADISNLQVWLKTGKKTTIDLAKEKMREIIATHEVSTPLTSGQEEDIEKILNDAKKYYKQQMDS
jgi:trimethylamine--corrinoid protein Co-methyltransferase